MTFPLNFVKKCFGFSKNVNFGPLIPLKILIDKPFAEIFFGSLYFTEVTEH